MSLGGMKGQHQTSGLEDVFTDSKRKRRNSDDSQSSYGNEDTTSDSQGADDNKNVYDANQEIKDLQKKIDVLKRKRKNPIGKPEKNRLFAQINRYNKKIESIQAEMATQQLHDEIARLKQLNSQLSITNVPLAYQDIVSQMNQLRQEVEQTKAEVQALAKDQVKISSLEEENKSLRQYLEYSKLENELLKAEAQLQQVRTEREKVEFNLLQSTQAHSLHATQDQFQIQQTQDIQNRSGLNLQDVNSQGVNPQDIHNVFRSQPPILHQRDSHALKTSVLTTSPEGRPTFRVVYAKPIIYRTSKK